MKPGNIFGSTIHIFKKQADKDDLVHSPVSHSRSLTFIFPCIAARVTIFDYSHSDSPKLNNQTTSKYLKLILVNIFMSLYNVFYTWLSEFLLIFCFLGCTILEKKWTALFVHFSNMKYFLNSMSFPQIFLSCA